MEKLQKQWFGILSQIYEETGTSVDQLPCFEHCPDRRCETNEKIYFLPFEMEFIEEKIGVDLRSIGAFWTLEIPVESGDEFGQTVTIGIKDRLRRCPFLNQDGRCSIRKNRPFDCRSFPLMPKFYNNGGIGIELEKTCPLVSMQILSKEFTERYQRLWYFLSEKLPASWKALYWYSSNIVPEIDDPEEIPRRIDLSERLTNIL